MTYYIQLFLYTCFAYDVFLSLSCRFHFYGIWYCVFSMKHFELNLEFLELKLPPLPMRSSLHGCPPAVQQTALNAALMMMVKEQLASWSRRALVVAMSSEISICLARWMVAVKLAASRALL